MVITARRPIRRAAGGGIGLERLAKWIVKCRVLIIVVAVALLVPSAMGYIGTRINYDILSYLPEDLESMQGQDCLDREFGIASTAIITVEHMPVKELLDMKAEIEQVPGVKEVLWQDNVLDVTVPTEMIPDDISSIYYRDDATMMLVTFDGGTSDDRTISALEQIEKLLRKDCFMGGISAIEADLKALFNSEMPIYVLVAVALSAVILSLGQKSTLVPFIFILGIGFAVVYNMGTNIFFGEISFITEALAAVLQLAVTTDFSIFLLDRYDEELDRGLESREAMAKAIHNTFTSIVGSSTTTIAGFLAMCTMDLELGSDIGLVMAKGVVFGVLTTVIVLPALILFFDKPIHKYTHRTFIPQLTRTSDFVVRHRKPIVIIALLLFIPFSIAQNKTSVYYTLFDSLPGDLPAIVGTDKMKEDFDMATTHFVILDDSVEGYQVADIVDQIEQEKGITSVVAYEKFLGGGIPEEFIPQSVKDIFQSGDKKMFVVSTSVKPGTPGMTAQLENINRIIKQYDPGAMVAGEGAMTQDLITVADHDFANVSVTSILVVFVIIALVFKSASLPVLLVAAIELAIMINMGIPYFTGSVIPFISSIVIGTIQLGATVDYAILMTTRFQEERQAGREKLDAVRVAASTSSQSIITSGLTFFAANIGVVAVSKIELIQSICMLLARGAVISMVVILFVMPAILAVCSGVIERTSWDWLGKKKLARKARREKAAAAKALTVKGEMEG